jgi:hypothetical protein
MNKELSDMSVAELNDKSFRCGQKLLKLNREHDKLVLKMYEGMFEIIIANNEYSKYLLAPRVIEDEAGGNNSKILCMIKKVQLELDRQHVMLDGIVKLNNSGINKDSVLKELVLEHKKTISDYINTLRHMLHNYVIQQNIRNIKTMRN